jgi:hypothetical protein
MYAANGAFFALSTTTRHGNIICLSFFDGAFWPAACGVCVFSFFFGVS